MRLDNFVEHKIFLYAMVVMAGIGVLGKMIAQLTLKHMMKEAENIHKSNHRLMKLIKAKYEHANIMSDRVKNVGIFVDKYLYGYRVLGISIYTWQSWVVKSMWITIAFGVLGAALEYLRHGGSEMVFQYVAWTGVLSMIQFLFHVMSNVHSKIEATRTYVVDYLENVCAHRYEKMMTEEKEKEPVKTEVTKEEIEKKEVEEKKISQEIRIREILEEFLA